MQVHANAKLGPAGRRELVRIVEAGQQLGSRDGVGEQDGEDAVVFVAGRG